MNSNLFEKRGLILWDLAAEKVQEQQINSNDEPEEKNVLFVGNRDSGKS